MSCSNDSPLVRTSPHSALLGGQFRVQQQPGHAITPFIGVRISWAHVGQKLALSFVGGIRATDAAGTFGFFLKASIALHQCCRRFLLGSDVPIRAHNFCRITRASHLTRALARMCRMVPSGRTMRNCESSSFSPRRAALICIFFEVAVFRVYQGSTLRTWDDLSRGAVKAVHLSSQFPHLHRSFEPDARALRLRQFSNRPWSASEVLAPCFSQ